MRLLPLVAGLALLAAGCATGEWSVKAVEPRTAPPVAYTQLAVRTTLRYGLTRPEESTRERLVALVIAKVQEKARGRFTAFNPPGAGPGTPGVLHATIEFREYDGDSTLSRAMLAGIGQLNIAADVILEDRARPARVGRYEVKRTVAWDEAYDVLTKPEELEAGFADAVASAILGHVAK